MDPAWWTMKTVYEAYPSGGAWNKGPFDFKEQNGVLNFASNDTALEYDGRKKYNSTWVVDFSSDFQFSAQYNTPSPASPNPKNGSIEIGLHNGVDEHFELWSGAYNDGTKNVFSAEIDLKEFVPKQVARPDSGVIGIRYSKADDKLEFIGGASAADTYAYIDDFTKKYGAYDGFQNLRVYLEGDSVFSAYNATFDNFNFQGKVTPEPVSSALFLLGGSALALKRFRKKKMASGR